MTPVGANRQTAGWVAVVLFLVVVAANAASLPEGHESMRSVTVHLYSTTEEAVVRLLQRTYPSQQGPPWVATIEGDPCLYIHLYRGRGADYEVEEWAAVTQLCGGEPSVSVTADISGRHPGDEQVRQFVITLLGTFGGAAQDEYSNHLWALEDVATNRRVHGHPFFDYKSPSPRIVGVKA